MVVDGREIEAGQVQSPRLMTHLFYLVLKQTFAPCKERKYKLKFCKIGMNKKKKKKDGRLQRQPGLSGFVCSLAFIFLNIFVKQKKVPLSICKL